MDSSLVRSSAAFHRRCAWFRGDYPAEERFVQAAKRSVSPKSQIFSYRPFITHAFSADSLSWMPLFTHFLKMLFPSVSTALLQCRSPQCNEKCLQHLLIQPIQFFTEKCHQPAHVPLEAEFPSSRSGQIHFSASQSHAHGFIHALPQHAYNRHPTLSPEESQGICNFLSYAQAPFSYPPTERYSILPHHTPNAPRDPAKNRAARKAKLFSGESHTRLYRHHHLFTASYAFQQAAAEWRPARRY